MEVNATTLMAEPEVGAYDCYRKLLLDFVEYRRSKNRRLSYRHFSRIAGFSSPNYLQSVIRGERSLTEGSARLVSKALKMSSAQKEYFLSLVKESRATNSKERLLAERTKNQAFKKIVSKEIPAAQSKILTIWYGLLVRELVALPEFRPDPKWMSDKLLGLVSCEDAEETFTSLMNLGFVIFENGKYRVNDPILDTGNNFTHVFMQGCHAKVLKNWAENISHLSSKEQELGLLNITIPTGKIPELRERLQQFQEELLGWLQKEKDCDRVAQVGIYFFPFG